MMKMFALLKLMPLFWQGHAQDGDVLIQIGKKNDTVLGLVTKKSAYQLWQASNQCKGTNYYAGSCATGSDPSTVEQCYQFCETATCVSSFIDCSTYQFQYFAFTDDFQGASALGANCCKCHANGCTPFDPPHPSWVNGGIYMVTTGSPTPAPPAGAYGDPHCVNAKGDWFDIYAVGRIPMVILPLGTSIEDGDFAVIATTTTPDGWDKCAPTFISAVDVWANQAHDQLRVDAGPAGDLQVKPMNGSTEPYSIKMLSEKVMITFRSVIVSVILNKVPKIDQAPFLYFDMEVAGLQALKAGGILGADPHDFAQVQPDGCSDIPLKHRAVDRYSTARSIP